jgi:exodeoxyribonuclease VII large subunit
VLVRGKLDIYANRGVYQIYAINLLPIGAGAKARAKEMLKAKLEKEGLFDPRHKRPVPQFPQKVAVITSPTGAALQDVIKISRERFPVAALLVIPSLMQGLSAPQEIASAFAACSSRKDLSAVMLVRGGGSRDDLDPFDSEMVVRAMRSCPVPVVTGLGHQIDTTLADMAADLFAPTPSGAAERLFPDGRDLAASIKETGRIMNSYITSKIAKNAARVEDSERRLAFAAMKNVIEPRCERLKTIDTHLKRSINFRIESAEAALKSTASALDNSSPLAILSKGYAICRTENGDIVRSVKALNKRDKIELQMRDGIASATVTGAVESSPEDI